MGYPLADVAGSGSLIYSSDSGINVELVEWYVDGAVDPGGEGFAADIVPAGGGQACGDAQPDPDGIVDLVGKLVLNVTIGGPKERLNPGDSIQAAIQSAEPGTTLVLSPGTYNESGSFFGNKDITIVGDQDDGGMVEVVFGTDTDWASTIQPGVAQLYENATVLISGIHFKVDVTGLSNVIGNGQGITIFKKGGGPTSNVTVQDCIFEYVGTPETYDVFNAQLVRFEGGVLVTS